MAGGGASVRGARPSLLRRVVFALLPCVLLLLVIEGVAQLVLALQPERVRHEGRHRNRAPVFEPHPFLVYASSPAYPDHDDRGLRRHGQPTRGEPELRILALGGSSTYGTRVGPEESYPARLEAQLRAEGRDVRVLNAGLAGYNSAHLLPLLALRGLAWRPDLLLVYAGFNDARMRIDYAGFEADYRHAFRPWDAPAARRPLWARTATVRLAARLLGRELAFEPHIQEIVNHLPSADAGANVAGSSVATFRRNLRSLVAVARAHGVAPVLVTQAHDFDGHEIAHPELWRAMMAESNQAVRAVAAEQGALLVDLAPRMSGRSEWFADAIHMNAAGNRERARLLAEALAEAGLLPRAQP